MSGPGSVGPLLPRLARLPRSIQPRIHIHRPALARFRGLQGKYPPPHRAARQGVEETSRMAERWCGGVCSLSMATSTGTATALLRPSRPAVPAKRRCLHGVDGRTTTSRRRGAAVVMRACFNPLGDERILREAIKEPVAFLGGVFAGLLRLDLNEDPLKEWISRTVEASGIAEENSSEESSEADQNDAPQQIEIE